MLAKIRMLVNSRLCSAIVFLLPALMTHAASAATNPDYDIEIVILEDLSGRYLNAENWPAIPEQTNSNTKSVQLMAADNDKRVKILPPDSYKLDDELKRLEDNKEYKVLLHTAWRQAGLDKPNAFPVHLVTDNQQENETSSYIEGDVTLVLSRYLHISGNLTFYKQGKGDSYIPYPVSFDRRMRSREIHYIDHPAISLLVLVTPVR